MQYSLVVWEGGRPPDDVTGKLVYEEMLERYLAPKPALPTPAIKEFVTTFAATWPDSSSAVSGPVVGFRLPDGSWVASSVIAQRARDRGLVCFDPQLDMLRPLPEEGFVKLDQLGAWLTVAQLSPKRPVRRRALRPAE